MDVDAEFQYGGDLGDVEGGVGGVPHGDKFSDYKRVTVGRVEMNGGTGGSGAARQNIGNDPFKFSAGRNLIHTVSGIGESSCHYARATPGVQVGGAASGCEHLLVCWRDPDLDSVSDGKYTGVPDGVKAGCCGRPNVLGVVTCETAEGSSRSFDGFKEVGGVVEVGWRELVFEGSGVNLSVERSASADAKEDLMRRGTAQGFVYG
jgi:hypothetical protein